MRQMAKGAAVVRLARLDADGLEQYGRRDMMRVGDERERHPGADGFVRCMHAPRVAAGAEAKDESAGQG
jgi:hypothetical protein